MSTSAPGGGAASGAEDEDEQKQQLQQQLQQQQPPLPQQQQMQMQVQVPRKSSEEAISAPVDTAEEEDVVDSTDVEEFEMSKVDRDVREILNVEQSHIAHVGLMENLRQFYLAHNPRILQSPNFLRDLVSSFEGREKQLFEKLEQTYQTNDPMAFVCVRAWGVCVFLSPPLPSSLLSLSLSVASSSVIRVPSALTHSHPPLWPATNSSHRRGRGM
jgi:hypothetical protein